MLFELGFRAMTLAEYFDDEVYRKDCIALLQAACDQGHAHAAGLIGTIFYYGRKVKPE